MKRTIRRPPSALTRLKPSIVKAVPGGLPPEVAEFYAQGDGLTVTLDIAGGSETATIEPLRRMFGGSFAPPVVVDDLEDADDALIGGSFQDIFYNDQLELTGRSARARLNLLLRLRLVTSFAGQSAAIGVDFHAAPGEPTLYYVSDAFDACPLTLGFAEYVAHFAKFGDRRWFFAFLEPKAARVLNLDLAAEFDASMAPFSDPEVESLRARFGRQGKPAAAAKTEAAKKSTAAKTEAAKKSTAKKSTAKKSTAKTTTAKKSTAKTTTAKKSTAKKSTAKKSTAKQSARVKQSGVAKKATKQRAPAKQSTTRQSAPARPSTTEQPAAAKQRPAPATRQPAAGRGGEAAKPRRRGG